MHGAGQGRAGHVLLGRGQQIEVRGRVQWSPEEKAAAGMDDDEAKHSEVGWEHKVVGHV